MANNPNPTATGSPAPRLGGRCPLGHEYAQRSETDSEGDQVMVVFCPACEPLAPAEPPAVTR